MTKAQHRIVKYVDKGFGFLINCKVVLLNMFLIILVLFLTSFSFSFIVTLTFYCSLCNTTVVSDLCFFLNAPNNIKIDLITEIKNTLII